MGEEKVKLPQEQSLKEQRDFVRHLLNDVEALDYMLNNDWFETDTIRIGAEQEMCLIDSFYKPAYKAMDILKEFHPEWLTTELAQFNLEMNLNPREFSGSSLFEMEQELRRGLDQVEKVANANDARILLTGIMPSLRKFDLHWDKLTPKPRYFALMKAFKDMRGSDYELRFSGIDELNIRHDSPLLEACNTSFQVHLQVTPDNFVQMYNIAQAITGPVLGMCANSPVLFGKRLWHESRIALFQQSIDNRTSSDHLRDRTPRVSFGNDWLDGSILNLYKEDIMRFRILLASDIEENSLQKVSEGIAPKLKALQVHNGTVYRWNRPCYGISPNGKPHLRIENRVFGAGPTVLDEMANTTFWLGLMEGMGDQYTDIREHISFDDARDNFIKGARTGIDSKYTWLNNQKIASRELVLKELLPLAKHGLEKRKIDSEHIDRYLGVIEERAKQHMNGARWVLQTFTKFKNETNIDESLTALTSAIYHNQKKSKPAHEWPLPSLKDFDDYNPSFLLVEEAMSTDILTLRKDDLLEYASALMSWSETDHMAVEDNTGKLVGLLTGKRILEQLTKVKKEEKKDVIVEDIMYKNPIVVDPQMTILEVIDLMKEHKVKVFPVVKRGELIGTICEKNFVNMSQRLIKRMNEEDK